MYTKVIPFDIILHCQYTQNMGFAILTSLGVQLVASV